MKLAQCILAKASLKLVIKNALQLSKIESWKIRMKNDRTSQFYSKNAAIFFREKGDTSLRSIRKKKVAKNNKYLINHFFFLKSDLFPWNCRLGFLNKMQSKWRTFAYFQISSLLCTLIFNKFAYVGNTVHIPMSAEWHICHTIQNLVLKEKAFLSAFILHFLWRIQMNLKFANCCMWNDIHLLKRIEQVFFFFFSFNRKNTK